MIAAKKQKLITELLSIINNWNEYSKEIYGYSKKDAENFLKRIQTGIYSSVLKNTYWFMQTPLVDTLIKIEVEKKNLKSLTNITEENFIVYSCIQEIKEHLDFIYYWDKAYKINYQTKENNYNQPPATLKEQEQFELLYKDILNKNYTWYEAKNIVKELKDLNIKENKNFPHNIKEIRKIFTSKYEPQYTKYIDQIKYSTNILELNKVVTTLLNNLNKNNLDEFIETKKKNIYEEYIRQQFINLKITKLKDAKALLKTLITEKKCIDLSELDIPQPELTPIRKQYNFIYKYTTELEFLEESVEILEKLKEIYQENELYKIILIYNSILISNGIIPIILTKKILKTKDKELKLKILEETIEQTKKFNK